MSNKSFVNFSKPIVDGLKETFSMMIGTEIEIHSPQIKKNSRVKGDITATIGMNGNLEKNGQSQPFKGLVALSLKESTYLKIASAMLMEDYTEYNEEVSDVGSEIVNIVMGNAKKELAPQGYKIEMATPSTVRGKNHEIRYPPETQIVETVVSCEFGDFTLEICYQESIL